jgi:hypothetical protein
MQARQPLRKRASKLGFIGAVTIVLGVNSASAPAELAKEQVDSGITQTLAERAGRVSFDRYSHDQHFQFYERLLQKLSAIPGIQAASAGWPLPLSDSRAAISFAIAGRPVAPGDRPNETIGIVMPGYFETLRIPLLSGRTFTDRDGLEGSPVAIAFQGYFRVAGHSTATEDFA